VNMFKFAETGIDGGTEGDRHTKPSKLRLKKNVVRTLTGTELADVGGGQLTSCQPSHQSCGYSHTIHPTTLTSTAG